MDRKTARRIADALTWARIWGALPVTLVAWLDLRWWVFALYAAMALTDLFDGMFARRADPSPRSSDFDGKADVFFSLMTLVWIWMLVPGFYERYGLLYLPLLFVIEVYLISTRIRYPRLPIPHFQFGRYAMTLFCFLLPVLIVLGDQPVFVHFVFVVGTLSKLQLARHIWREAIPRHARDIAA